MDLQRFEGDIIECYNIRGINHVAMLRVESLLKEEISKIIQQDFKYNLAYFNTAQTSKRFK